MKEIGNEAAFMKMQYPEDGDERFHWDRGYVVVIEDEKGSFLTHPVYPGKVGQEYLNQKDNDGKPYIQEFIRIAKTKDKGWATFNFDFGNVKEKRDYYILKVPDENLIVISVLRHLPQE